MVTQVIPDESVPAVVVPLGLPDAVLPAPSAESPATGVPTLGEPAPSLTPAGPSPEVVAARQELAQARQRLAQVEAERQFQANEAALQREFQAVYQEELTQNQSETDALRIARRHLDLSRRVGLEEQRLRSSAEAEQGKRNAAAYFGKQYGVDPSLLMVAGNPEDMEAMAQREKRYAGIEADVKNLKQGRVPAQVLDAASGSRAGGVVATLENIDKLWLDHERLRPGAPNPYEAQYRKFLTS